MSRKEYLSNVYVPTSFYSIFYAQYNYHLFFELEEFVTQHLDDAYIISVANAPRLVYQKAVVCAILSVEWCI